MPGTSDIFTRFIGVGKLLGYNLTTNSRNRITIIPVSRWAGKFGYFHSDME
jgi:hypothetical protein